MSTTPYSKVFDIVTKLIGSEGEGEYTAPTPNKGSSSAPSNSTSKVSAVTGEDKKANIKRIAEYLKSIGVTREGALGLIGNILGESQANPKASERNSSIGGKGGIGIVQWTGPRRKKLEAAAGSNIETRNDLDFQLQYLEKELKNSYSAVYKKLTTSKSLEETTIFVLERFEVPGTYLNRKTNPDAYTATKNKRINYAKSVISIIDEVYKD
jgi:hypothetical protein